MYKERSTPRWFIWVVLVIASSISFSVWAVLSGGDALDLATTSAVTASLALASVILFAFRSYGVEVGPGTLHFGYAHWSVRLATSDLVSASKTELSWWSWGGLGWRLRGGKNIGYINGGGRALVVVVRCTGRRYTFNCEDPDRVLALLREAGGPDCGPDC